MGPHELLRVVQEDDGDMLLVINDSEKKRTASIQFCMPSSGGGQSPKTIQALRSLARAMAEDAIRRPQPDCDPGEEFTVGPADPMLIDADLFARVLQSFQELHYSVTNWMEIADKEDHRSYDDRAVKRARRVYKALTGRDLAGDEKQA